MPAHPDWIEHRRGDRERPGWMFPEDDGLVVIDLLGRRVTEPLDWSAAEEFLDNLGIGYLANPFGCSSTTVAACACASSGRRRRQISAGRW